MSGTVDANTPGEYVLTYSATNGYATTTVTRVVRVKDTIAPVVNGFRLSRSVLAPPNHKLVDVFVSYQVSDRSSDVRCGTSVSSNEPLNGAGDGNTAVDWIVDDSQHVRLRAERSGGGGGRTYTITVTCQDPSMNTAVQSGQVLVPR